MNLNSLLSVIKRGKHGFRIKWIENSDGRRRLTPLIPKENKKAHYLRNILLEDWVYFKHYVDSAIKQAYSIIVLEKKLCKGREEKTEALS